MFVDMIIHSLNHHIMMMFEWLYYLYQHTREIFTNVCAWYYLLFKSIGTYYYSIFLHYQFMIIVHE